MAERKPGKLRLIFDTGRLLRALGIWPRFKVTRICRTIGVTGGLEIWIEGDGLPDVKRDGAPHSMGAICTLPEETERDLEGVVYQTKALRRSDIIRLFQRIHSEGMMDRGKHLDVILPGAATRAWWDDPSFGTGARFGALWALAEAFGLRPEEVGAPAPVRIARRCARSCPDMTEEVADPGYGVNFSEDGTAIAETK